jgi:tripartite-type tricarboxylate transporter receptor subunit TctC
MSMVRRSLRGALVVIALACGVFGAHAQDYPSRPVTLVMPYPPGGGTDFIARLLTQALERRLGQTFVLDYRPGAGSAIAATYVSRQPADGYTLLYATSTTMAINVSVHKHLNYDPTKDLVPVAMIAVSPFILVVNAALPIGSIAELVAYAKTHPGALTYASNGPGGASHLFAELLKSTLGIEMTHIPYKGNAPALYVVVAGHVSLMFVDQSSSVQLVREGRLRVLGITSAARTPIAPEIPPLAEVGVPGYDAASWHMIVAPAATPKPIVDRLNAELTAIVKDETTAREFSKRGFAATASGPPAELEGYVKSEIARWGKVVRQAGVAGSE